MGSDRKAKVRAGVGLAETKARPACSQKTQLWAPAPAKRKSSRPGQGRGHGLPRARRPQQEVGQGTAMSGAAAAFLVGSAKHGTQPVAALESAAEAGAGTLANPLGTLNRLKLLLSSLGIPVNHLIEGSQKCVAELGPEAMEAVKALRALLGALTMFG
ncbi:secretoglobin family 3A member 1 isoform X2 [Pongo pygmaeus]|uniref:secretoglobin family 3A member 1 isoform X2 n=1 Tax=Pongo pygmaeus TaxID=9600 RepID=UPI0023E0CFA0|nr:secretoglobin family 3A member 1 isoform X2 [Pongo pygmaeus]